MKRYSIIILLIICVNGFSQIEKDTVFIYFDSTNSNMKKSSFKAFKSYKYPDELIETSFSYKINEKTHKYSGMYDSGYLFTHYRYGKVDLDKGGKQPAIIEKPLSFLRTIKPLNIDFFLNTDYNKVCKVFEEEDSWMQDVIIFIIDKDEIMEGKIVLRQVRFNRPSKE